MRQPSLTRWWSPLQWLAIVFSIWFNQRGEALYHGGNMGQQNQGRNPVVILAPLTILSGIAIGIGIYSWVDDSALIVMSGIMLAIVISWIYRLAVAIGKKKSSQ